MKNHIKNNNKPIKNKKIKKNKNPIKNNKTLIKKKEIKKNKNPIKKNHIIKISILKK